MDIMIPTNAAEMEEIRKIAARAEISEDDLDSVVGGNDDLKGKTAMNWTCPFCGALVRCKQMQDAAKHMTKCPNNPYK